MSHRNHPGKVDIRLPLLSSLVLLLVLAVIAIQFKDTDPDLESRVRNLVRKEEMLSRMQVSLLKSVDIEKAAVMATTDELSRSLAEESLRSAEAVERDRLELSRLIAHDHTDKETSLLGEFNSCWAELQKIDKAILDFAVENTNIKASVLSFTRGRNTVIRLKRSLTEVAQKSASSGEYSQLSRLTCDAVTAALEIHSLLAPHIAAASDEDMDRIEKEIRQLEETLGSSLNELERFSPEEAQSLLKQAVTASAELQEVTTAVLRLSRQNTNIKSFELSLGRKRKISAQCDEILGSLQADIRSRTFDATR